MEEQLLKSIMSDHQLTEALEYRLLNAWPSLECQFYNGWVARFADRYTKRANSVSPLWQGATLDDELIHHIVGQYRQMNAHPIFRLTGLEAEGVDALLASHGFNEFQPSYCMIHDNLHEFEAEDAISISSDLPEKWVQDIVHSQHEDEAERSLRDLVSRIRQTHGFATLVMDDQPVAWGLGVVERGFVGLYDIVVLPDLRGLGLGRRVLGGLIDWGRQNGAQHAYLQVTEENKIARSLYASIGFRNAYRYHYRVLPTEIMEDMADNDSQQISDWNLPIVG